MSTEPRHQFPHLGFQIYHAAAAPEKGKGRHSRIKPKYRKIQGARQLAVTHVFRYSALLYAGRTANARVNLDGRRGEQKAGMRDLLGSVRRLPPPSPLSLIFWFTHRCARVSLT